MSHRRPFDAEWSELERIDYFLDHLARAVERDEVPRASYDRLAPRYLARREDLVAIVTGAHRTAAASATGGRSAPVGTVVSLPSTGSPVQPLPAAAAIGGGASATPHTYSQPAPVRAATPPKPVPWTTVLLFLGAFLVIVASSIFAVAVWDLLGATGKLAFLGALTAGFYVAGWWARVKLQLRAGATALTAVASAMLLLDGWIAIDGYGLQGPLPWAAVMLVCSGAYWLTEVRLADRFFGVIGAAAQMGWWWLLGAGLGLPAPLVLAGMSVVALLWQLGAERGRDDKTVGSLALVLEFAAPLAVLLLSLGMLANFMLIGTATLVEVASAAVIAACAAVVVARNHHLAGRPGELIAALLQVPLFIAVAVAAFETIGHSWWLAATLALMALAYAVFALLGGGAAFAAAGLLAELGFVLETALVLNIDDRVTVVLVAALAAMWGASSRMSEALARGQNAPRGARAVSFIAEGGSLALLVAASLVAPAVVGALPLTGSIFEVADALAILGVLVSWAAAAVVRPRAHFAAGTAAYSLVAAAGLLNWLLPGLASATYATVLLLVAGAWIAFSGLMRARLGGLFTEGLRWAARAMMAAILVSGAALEIASEMAATWPLVALLLAAAAVFALDAWLLASVLSAAIAGVAAVCAAFAAGDLLVAGDARSLAAAIIAVAVAGAAYASRSASGWRGVSAGLGASAAGVVFALASWGSPGTMAVALALIALAWLAASLGLADGVAFLAGLTAMGAAAAFSAWIEGGTWATIVVLVLAMAALGAASFIPVSAPGGNRRVAGASLGLGGLVGLAVALAAAYTGNISSADAAWLGLSGHQIAFGLLALGAQALVLALVWTFEPGVYAALAVFVLAVWMEFWAVGVEVGEWYTTALALYLVACGYVFLAREPGRRFPAALDPAAVVVGLGIPLLWGLTAPGASALVHAAWVLGLSLMAIGAGIALKVRWYFFGGVIALALVAAYRSFAALADYWWLLLGFVGIIMLVIALTWERQRVLVSDTRERLRASFEGWR